MLTLKEIKEVSFGKAGFSGYKPEDVDKFIDDVAEAFQRMQEENEQTSQKVAQLTAVKSELQEKLSVLAEKIESYRRDEEGIKDALITAQVAARAAVRDAEQKAETTMDSAEQHAKNMLEEAESERNRILDETRQEAEQTARHYTEQIDAKKDELEEIKKQVNAFRISLLEMYKKHLECIDSIPTFRQKEENTAHEPKYQMQNIEQEMSYEEDIQEQSYYQQEKPPLRANPQPTRAPAQVKPTPRNANNEMNRKVNYANQQQRRKAPEPASPVLSYTYTEENLTDLGINTTGFNSIPEPLLKEKKTGYTNLEFGEGVDVTNQ